jgi:hypothetical protein
MPAFDERSISSLVNFENVDSLSDILLTRNDMKTAHTKSRDNDNDVGMASCPPSSQNYDNENNNDNCNGAATAQRLATLQLRNQQLQRVLALASVQHSKEIAAMKRTIEKLEQQVAELQAERNGTTTR